MSEIYGFTRNELMELIWKRPSLAQIELTRNCNQSCCFCFQGSCSRRHFDDLNLEDWKCVIDKCKKLGIENINFSGGEVMMYKYIQNILEYTKSLGLRVVVNTNGMFDISNILQYTDKIIFSLHGLENTHNRIVGNNMSFKKITSNIKKANMVSVPVEVNMTLIKSNFNEVIDVYKYLIENYDIFQFSPSIAITTKTGSIIPEDEKLVINEELYQEYFDMLKLIDPDKLDLKQGMHTMYHNNIEKYETNGIYDSCNCIGGKTKLVIDYKANVYPCNFYQTQDYYCGNLLKESERDIWEDGAGFKKFRKLVLEDTIPENCHNCVKYYKCLGGCRAWTEAFSNGILNGEEFFKDVDRRCKYTHAFIRNRNNNSV